jgi:hypothetical protein
MIAKHEVSDSAAAGPAAVECVTAEAHKAGTFHDREA